MNYRYYVYEGIVDNENLYWYIVKAKGKKNASDLLIKRIKERNDGYILIYWGYYKLNDELIKKILKNIKHYGKDNILNYYLYIE